MCFTLIRVVSTKAQVKYTVKKDIVILSVYIGVSHRSIIESDTTLMPSENQKSQFLGQINSGQFDVSIKFPYSGPQ